ncbi:hypothetical protein Ancab_035091 [Ancistrocladus abbreviatus]
MVDWWVWLVAKMCIVRKERGVVASSEGGRERGNEGKGWVCEEVGRSGKAGVVIMDFKESGVVLGRSGGNGLTKRSGRGRRKGGVFLRFLYFLFLLSIALFFNVLFILIIFNNLGH